MSTYGDSWFCNDKNKIYVYIDSESTSTYMDDDYLTLANDLETSKYIFFGDFSKIILLKSFLYIIISSIKNFLKF